MNRSLRMLALAAAALLPGGCGDQAAAGAARLDLSAHAEPVEMVPIALEGKVDNRQPIGHAVKVAWIPLKSLFPEGQAIAEGDELAQLDSHLAELWRETAARDIRQRREEQSRDHLRAESQVSELGAAKRELEAQRDAYAAEIAATKASDANSLSIVRLELAEAERRFHLADATFDRVNALAGAGRASDLSLRQARDKRALAEAAVVVPRLRLELVEKYTGYVTRRRLELALAGVNEDIGDVETGHGVAGEIAALEEAQRHNELIAAGDLRALERDNALRQDIIDHPTIPATATGLVRYSDASVRPGAKLPASFFAYVLDSKELVVAFKLPERFRGLVQPWSETHPRLGLVRLHVDALPNQPGDGAITGRILSIAAVPESDKGSNGRSFSCAIRLDSAAPELRPGMRARCELLVPAPPAAVAVPTWCVADARKPEVVLPDGSRRAITGYPVGHDFLVTAGLAAGERVLASSAGAATGVLRVSGVVEPTRFQPVKLSSWNWQLKEVVPDGTLVEKDAIIARLSKSVRWQDAGLSGFAYEYGLASARARFAAARITAGKDLAKELLTWHKAAIAVERARLERLVTRFSGNDEQEANAQVDLTRAGIAAEQAEHAAAELADPAMLESLSLNERHQREVSVAQARLARQRADVQRVATLRARDWLAVTVAEEAERSSEEAATDARESYSAARAAYEAALARATLRFNDDLEDGKLRGDRAASIDQEVLAPTAGRVYRTRQWNGKPTEIGDEIGTMEPFRIPLGSVRHFVIEVPARLDGHFKLGQDIPFTIPTLGARPRAGTVTRISPFVADATGGNDELATRGTIGVPSKVFLMTISFDLAEDEQVQAPPGTTAYVDL